MRANLKAIDQELRKERQDDQLRQKLCLIEDIVKEKILLYGLGDIKHDEFLTDTSASKLFDVLYDHDIFRLELIRRFYERKINELIKQRSE